MSDPEKAVDETVELQVDDAGRIVGDDDTPEELPEQSQEAQGKGELTPRQQARRNRYRDIQEERDRLRRELEEQRIAVAEMRGQLTGLTTAHQQAGSVGRSQPQTKVAPEVRALQQRRTLMLREFDMLPEADKTARHAEYQERVDELDAEIIQTAASLVVGRAQPSTEESAKEVYRQMLWQEHRDIFSDRRALALAQSKIIRKTQVEGRQPNRALDEEVFDEVRRELGMRRQGQPTAGQRAATTSMGVNAGMSVDQQPRTVNVPWNEVTKQMAAAAFPRIRDEAELKRKFMEMQAKESR